MAELADAIDLGSIPKGWGFKSLYPHQNGGISPLLKTPKTQQMYFRCFLLGYTPVRQKSSINEIWTRLKPAV